MKVLIINYNRLTLPKLMVEWLLPRGLEPIFIDNNSDYGPLLDYYKTCHLTVARLPHNYGHTVIWNTDILDKLRIHERFILTDPDLDLTGVPDDFLDKMNMGLNKYQGYSKCGLSLEINDLPDTKEGNFIKNGPEAPYWLKPLDELFFEADTDTTFALYRYPVGEYSHSAIRMNRPYTARHLPWYYTDINLLTEDEQYYYRTAKGSSSSHVLRLNSK